VHAHPVLVTEDGDRMQRKLVGSPENADRNLSTIRNQDLALFHDCAVRTNALMDAMPVTLMALIEDFRILVLLVASHLDCFKACVGGRGATAKMSRMY